MGRYMLLNEIHNFHTNKVYLFEYQDKVKNLRFKINKVTQMEMQNLDALLSNKDINQMEYNILKEIIEFKRKKYQEIINYI